MWKSTLAWRVIPLVSIGLAIVAFLFLFKGVVEPIRVALPWLHQAQFAGMYVADAQGYYKNEGLAIHLIERNFNGSLAVDLLNEKKADIAVMSPGEFLSSASQGKDVVALAAVFQASPIVIASLTPAGIKAPKDLSGKNVGISKVTEESKLPLYALLKETKIPETSVIFSEVGYNQVDALLRGDVDAISIYRTNELYELENRNVPYSVIFPERFGVDMYGDIIVTSKAYLLRHKKQVGGFLRATFKGWEAAEKDPYQATLITLNVDNLKYHDFAREAYILKNALMMVRQHPKQNLGQMVSAHWAYLYKLFQGHGLVNDIELNNFFIHASVYQELGFP